MTQRRGGGRKLFVAGVRPLDPEQATFAAMLDGWVTQQRARLLRESTGQARLSVIRRFAVYTNDYPWQWSSIEAEEFLAHLASSTRASTMRGHQAALRLFMCYLVDPQHERVGLCEQRFGAAPKQVLHEWNTYHHVNSFEGDPSRRPMTYDEIQALFDAVDGLVEPSEPGAARVPYSSARTC